MVLGKGLVTDVRGSKLKLTLNSPYSTYLFLISLYLLPYLYLAQPYRLNRRMIYIIRARDAKNREAAVIRAAVLSLS